MPERDILEILRSKQIPSLNGIRALAATVVLLYHFGFLGLHGSYGVTIFFVLSGFLITHLLLTEREKFGSISLRGFYLRRTLRIFPAFYVFMAVYLLLRYATHAPIYWPQAIASLTYTRDYYDALVHPGKMIAGHTWSLAIEEQFYLLWPFLFVRFQPKHLAKILAGFIVAVWIYRPLHDSRYIYYAFETRADALAVGCLVAVLIHLGYNFRWLTAKWMIAPVLLATLAVMKFAAHDNPLTLSIFPLLAMALILESVVHRYWLLNNPVANYLGLVSYPLYLYHPMLASSHLSGWTKLAVTLAFASLSYYVVERPFLQLKNSLHRKKMIYAQTA
jgi:peptidoglycan/LPS O-acetylase OafA/YrhL